MRAAPLLLTWHDESAAIYSAHFEPHGKGRLATAGGDNNVRLWKVEYTGEDRKITYLSTLVKHTQAVNVVRWCPRGEMLASAGDDGNVLFWVPSEIQQQAFGVEGLEDKETWRVKHMCRSFGSEIYDLGWSPDGIFIIAGSMDNIARIYNATNGQCVRQIAEHSHYVQGVAWDPLNEFVATQSSDRSVHIYTLKTKDGQFSLAQHSKVTKMDLPPRRISSSSPAPPDFGARASFMGENSTMTAGSPVPSAPGTPSSFALAMKPPPTTHSRRSSFSSSRRSVSPAPSLPLPAVMPANSPKITGLGVKNTNIYANETLTSFFRRLTFAPDGSLLCTPAGQYKTSHPVPGDAAKTAEDIINTVYIYTRAGLNKPPIAYLPGHKKPSVAIRFSPIFYTLRQGGTVLTKTVIMDSAEGDIPALPEPAIPSRMPISNSSMDPPPLTSAPSPSPSVTTATTAASPRPSEPDSVAGTSAPLPAGPPMAFNLPYRMVYAVATQDAVFIYDTQQMRPLCVVSNLHYTTFTDLAWSSDGLTLIMTSTDGFCSCMTFAPGELGQVYEGPRPPRQHPSFINTSASSPVSTPIPTPTQPTIPSLVKQPSFPASPSCFTAAGPASPARSMSTSSVATQPGQTPIEASSSMINAIPSFGTVPGVAASTGTIGGVPMWTPPMTPMGGNHGTHSAASSVSGAVHIPGRWASESEKDDLHRERKREGEPDKDKEEGKEVKRRRIAPTLVGSIEDQHALAPAQDAHPPPPQ